MTYECGREKQFHCGLCSYRAKRKENLKKHMYIKHNTSNVFSDYFVDE